MLLNPTILALRLGRELLEAAATDGPVPDAIPCDDHARALFTRSAPLHACDDDQDARDALIPEGAQGADPILTAAHVSMIAAFPEGRRWRGLVGDTGLEPVTSTL